MRSSGLLRLIASAFWISSAGAISETQAPFLANASGSGTPITPQLFAELEELARIVDIAYCVGGSGIQKPFECNSRCDDFPTFELVTTWSTGVLLSDSCGYIALDHNRSKPRVILAFRGTYSLANAIVDLSTVPQEYVPYPNDGDSGDDSDNNNKQQGSSCDGCSVHSGFLRSWRHTRSAILEDLLTAVRENPTYELNLVGHSLGGAVALLAALDLKARGYAPHVTTFGEPRVGNDKFVKHVNDTLLHSDDGTGILGSALSYRRVTHVDDPVPLLPLTEWGYKPHAGELYIAKGSIPADVGDVRSCDGDADESCSAGGDSTLSPEDEANPSSANLEDHHEKGSSFDINRAWDLVKDAQANAEWATTTFPTRLKLWQLFFAHRDYFWRLGVCIPGGDPWDWKGRYPTDDEL